VPPVGVLCCIFTFLAALIKKSRVPLEYASLICSSVSVSVFIANTVFENGEYTEYVLSENL